MRVFAPAAAIAVTVASGGLSGCTSPGLVYPGLAAPAQYSGAPYAPAAVVYPEYGVPRHEAPPISAYEVTCRREQRAPRYGAADIRVASGTRAARHVPNLTPAPMDRAVLGSTPSPSPG